MIQQSNNSIRLYFSIFGCEFEVKSMETAENQENKKESLMNGFFNLGNY
jgi:hypothetical protein